MGDEQRKECEVVDEWRGPLSEVGDRGITATVRPSVSFQRNRNATPSAACPSLPASCVKTLDRAANSHRRQTRSLARITTPHPTLVNTAALVMIQTGMGCTEDKREH